MTDAEATIQAASERTADEVKRAKRAGRRGRLQPRERMLSAMLKLVGEHGYDATTVAHVIARAGASRRTFYQHFADREACFLAASTDLADVLCQRIEGVLDDAMAAGEDPVEALVGELFQVAIASPATARLVTAELAAAGTPGLEIRTGLMCALGRSLGISLAHAGEALTLDEALAGALIRIPYARTLRTGRRRSPQRGELSALIPDVARWVRACRSGKVPPLLPVGPPLLIGGRAPGTLSHGGRVAATTRGITRSENVSSSLMVHSQRERLLDAVANLSTVKGYGAVTIPEIVSEAGVSVQAFYGHFANRDDALLVAYELGHRKTVALVAEACSQHSGVDAVATGVKTLFGILASEPAFAHLALLDAPAAGSKIAALVQLGTTAYFDLLASMSQSIHAGPVPEVFVEASVGAVQELCYVHVSRAETASLPRLAAQAEHLLLAPLTS